MDGLTWLMRTSTEVMTTRASSTEIGVIPKLTGGGMDPSWPDPCGSMSRSIGMAEAHKAGPVELLQQNWIHVIKRASHNG